VQAPFFDAVVKVHCVHTEPNYSLPWQRKRQFTSTSSGFIVSGPAPGDRWLLTNAHSVDYHTQASLQHTAVRTEMLMRTAFLLQQSKICSDETWNVLHLFPSA
jgi:hypothetical protein